MEQNTRLFPVAAVILGLMIALGMSTAGFLIGKGFYKGKKTDRYVTVKGLAERDAKADLAIWNINFISTGNEIIQLHRDVEHKQQLVINFVKSHGFEDSEISLIQTRITDLYARGDQQANKIGPHYSIKGGVRVRSLKVDKIQQASEKTGELIQQGIVLGAEYESGGPNPIYLFTQINVIRPEMLANAIGSARTVAQQFAKDSGSRLGDIRHANQGVFEISSRDVSSVANPNDWQMRQDEQSSVYKKIRLVTTIEYLLKGH